MHTPGTPAHVFLVHAYLLQQVRGHPDPGTPPCNSSNSCMAASCCCIKKRIVIKRRGSGRCDFWH
eukprot:3506902-Rhodomonas_salina.1